MYDLDAETEDLYGLDPGRSLKHRPLAFAVNPLSVSSPGSALLDVAAANLYYIQLYAASEGKCLPTLLSACACGVIPIHATLLAGAADTQARFYDWRSEAYDTAQYATKPTSIKITEISSLMQRYCFQYQINTVSRLAAFIGNTAVESWGYTLLQEDITPEEANKKYALRMGNGDVKSGDGWRFRGRGIMQLTGRRNYTAFDDFAYRTKLIGNRNDILHNPDIVTKPEYAVLSAMWYWLYAQSKSLNYFADLYQFENIASLITAGKPDRSPKSWPRRKAYQQAAARLIAEELLLHARI